MSFRPAVFAVALVAILAAGAVLVPSRAQDTSASAPPAQAQPLGPAELDALLAPLA